MIIMDAGRLEQLLASFPGCRVAVLGDFFLDKYLDVDLALAEISLETGKTANQVVSIRSSPGAAGTVVNNLVALGAGRLHLVGFTGDDGEGYELRRALQNLGCDIDGIQVLSDRFTPTYLKPRDCRNADLSGEHERYDTKNRTTTPTAVQDRAVAHVARLLPSLDAVVVLDQVDEAECGIVTSGVRERLAGLAAAYPSKLFWADSRRRIGLFNRLVIKPNTREAVHQVFGEAADTGDDAVVHRAVGELRQRTGRPVFVTAGARGIWVSDPTVVLVRGVRVEEPTDPTGAGDSATAGAVLSLCAGASLEEAALIANLVASITVQQLATTGTATPAQLGPRLEMWRNQG
jgi:bifunctional ADP-heptose synthase (sugar kinase/adenylyltransferase)